VLVAGLVYHRRRRSGGAFALGAALAFAAALTAVVSSVALYIYEHPHHHCPFCLLKGGHDHIGYWLYIPLFAGTALSLGVGLVSRWDRIPSLTRAIRYESRRFTAAALALFAVFYVVATYAVLTSNLTMLEVWW
jgi:hypothetical protein